MDDLETPLWYMSFAEPGRFLGAVVTQAATMADAVTGTHLLGINPGGQIMFLGPMEPHLIAPEWRDRLLTADEAANLPDPFAGDVDHG